MSELENDCCVLNTIQAIMIYKHAIYYVVSTEAFDVRWRLQLQQMEIIK